MTQMQDKKVLVIDDDFLILKLIEQTFLRTGSQVYTASNGVEGLRQFYTHQPDLVILDLMMPGMDGWETCQHIRKTSQVPIIMLTALGSEGDIIKGLGDGADDYVTKPFLPNVLVARAKSALRRAQLPPTQLPTTYSDNYLTVDMDNRRVLTDGKPVKLSAKEYRLLTYLMKNAGRVLTFQQILENIWGWEYRDNIDYVHVYISHLRRKLEKDPKKPTYFLSEHGIGYRFETANDQSMQSQAA